MLEKYLLDIRIIYWLSYESYITWVRFWNWTTALVVLRIGILLLNIILIADHFDHWHIWATSSESYQISSTYNQKLVLGQMPVSTRNATNIMQRLLDHSYGNVTEKYNKNVVPIELDQPVVVQVGFYVSDMMPLIRRDKVK